MATFNQIKLEILPKNTKLAFDLLRTKTWLTEENWYLAGGTALALQMGHRLSVDLDFFTSNSDFEIANLINRLSSNHWQTTLTGKGTLYGELYQTKISFIAYPYFKPQHPFITNDQLNILDAKDIAVMKVIAISQRGRKRDFIDLYWYSINNEPLINILKRINQLYPNIEHSYHHILKSLSYFAEAENDPDLQFLTDISWDNAKKFFTDAIPDLAEELL